MVYRSTYRGLESAISPWSTDWFATVAALSALTVFLWRSMSIFRTVIISIYFNFFEVHGFFHRHTAAWWIFLKTQELPHNLLVHSSAPNLMKGIMLYHSHIWLQRQCVGRYGCLMMFVFTYALRNTSAFKVCFIEQLAMLQNQLPATSQGASFVTSLCVATVSSGTYQMACLGPLQVAPFVGMSEGHQTVSKIP